MQKPGNIRVEEYVRGIDFCIDNAVRLLEDAKTLDKNDRVASSLGLATFAWEELGKAVMLMDDLFGGRDLVPTDWEPRGKYLNHKTKLTAPSRSRVLLGQPRNPFPPEEEDRMSRQIHEGRLGSLFVDWSSINGWYSPTDPGNRSTLVLLLGSVLRASEGWLSVIQPFWVSRRQSCLNKEHT
jgi:AbiV family abortive infection protein